MEGFRIERDALGSVKVPAGAYFGAQTMRAIENFPISGLAQHVEFIQAYALVKKAAALANMKLGKLDRKRGHAIVQAAEDVMAGHFRHEFLIDIFQAGAGTCTNMNVNEVIANRANELLGGKKGEYAFVHPNDHVNMSQSTNDTYHATIHIATCTAIRGHLLPELEALQADLEKKSRDFSRVLKVGRTHLQDALPMTLGQEFSAYASAVSHAVSRLDAISDSLRELAIGGTAIGTGLNAGKKYTELALREINAMTKLGFRTSLNFFNASQNQNVEAEVSGALKTVAITLNKIANDLILLSSGPRAGLGEITLPAVQPGSSIMPGKVNPSMPEMLNMVCFTVIGNDATITEAARSGQLELNVYMPVIAYRLLDSVTILTHAIRAFRKRCVQGIRANEQKMREDAEKNPITATALAPLIGYEKASEIVRLSYQKNIPVRDLLLRMKLATREQLDKLLDSSRLVRGG
jgi:aspartate ammonia-lyase